MGKSIASFAGNAAMEQQKADLEKEQTILANQLREGSETRLIGVRGEEERTTGAANAVAQGTEQRNTAQFTNDLPMTAAQKAADSVNRMEAATHRMDASKPVSGSYSGAFMVYNPKTSEWEPQNALGDATPTKPLDPKSNNLTAQVGLSPGAIAVLSGQTQGMRMGQAQTQRIQAEIAAWGEARGINTSTIRPQVEGAFKTITQNVTRNNQAEILEHEISGSVENASVIADKVDLTKVNVGNVLAVWSGKQVNDNDAIQVADQFNRLREELAGYNAVAGGHLMDNGTPSPTPENFHAAEATITNGITSGGLKALDESVKMSAAKNKAILQQAIDDSNVRFYKLFGGTYHPEVTVEAPAAAKTDTPAAGVPPPKTPPDPKIQSQITAETIRSTAQKRSMTEEQVKKELQGLGYTVPE